MSQSPFNNDQPPYMPNSQNGQPNYNQSNQNGFGQQQPQQQYQQGPQGSNQGSYNGYPQQTFPQNQGQPSLPNMQPQSASNQFNQGNMMGGPMQGMQQPFQGGMQGPQGMPYPQGMMQNPNFGMSNGQGQPMQGPQGQMPYGQMQGHPMQGGSMQAEPNFNQPQFNQGQQGPQGMMQGNGNMPYHQNNGQAPMHAGNPHNVAQQQYHQGHQGNQGSQGNQGHQASHKIQGGNEPPTIIERIRMAPQNIGYKFSELDLSYIPLHVHSDYSIMDGLESVGAIVKRAAKLNIPAIALTDWTNVCGYIKFYSTCLASGIKPIMGADLKVADKCRPGEDPHIFRLTILAMDNKGRQNLYDILSEAWLRSDAGEFNATTKLEELAKFNEGIIVLNGFRGDLSHYIQEHEENKLRERLNFYLEHFGDRFCLELTRTNREGEEEFENRALELCMEYGIPPVATNDTCFLLGPNDIGKDGISDYEVHDVRVSIQNKCMRGNQEMARLYSPEQYLKSPKEMRELFIDLPEAIYNTRQIAERCNVDLELDHPRLPRYPTGDLTPAECLRQKAHEGLKERLDFLFPDPIEREAKRPEYEARLNTELDVIITMDFPGYFLIVMEFIQWSKDHGVPVGPGRGSGGGSLVAYALKITDFDPMAFDLLFERFLNPERVSMPDFDVDFCQRNREKTLEHVKVNYGKDAVSQIAAFGTMAPKAAIKDVGRALGMTYGSVDYVAKQLPAQPGLSFNAALGIDKKGNPCESVAPDFLNLYQQALQTDDKARIELIHYAIRLEGVIKIIGKHAAGVVISPTRTAEFTPLMLDSDGNPITQFDKKDVEHAGLVKFDFLGLTTLTIIQDAVNMINERKKRLNEKPVSIQEIPYHDEESFKTLQEGETTAVFQLESDGMRKLIGQMKPDRFDDMIALVALYRPGPIKSGMVDHFVKRKHGEEEVSYPSPDFQDLDLKPILDSTYGVIVYQEQVMQIAQVLAGYSLGGADILRRAMGKKNPAEMASQRSVFKEGAESKGKDPDIAMKIFDQVEKFAEYGFNKSHSAAYALVAWWTLYLKVHYPAEFLAAMMTADRQHVEKLVTYISECNRLNIKVNPPDVSVGRFDFTVDVDGSIIYGLGAIKGIGEELVHQIMQVRQEQHGFHDFFDFVAKVGTMRLNKKSMESLIFSGALDRLGPSRAQMFASITKALKYANQKKEEHDSGQTDLFSMLGDIDTGFSAADTPEYVECTPWPDKYIFQQEKIFLGLYLTGHPLAAYQEELTRFCSCSLSRLVPGTYERPVTEIVGGAVLSYTERVSKRDNSKFFIVTLDDSTSQLELVMYGNQAEQFAAILKDRAEAQERRNQYLVNLDDSQKTEAPLILIFSISYFMTNEGNPRTRVRKIETLERLRRQHVRNITISLPSDFYEQHAKYINDVIMRNAIPTPAAQYGMMQRGMPMPNGMMMQGMQQGNPNYMYGGNMQGSMQGGHSSIQNPNFADQGNGEMGERGCTLSMMIDSIKVNFENRYYRFIPSDDLIESIRDIAGMDAVQLKF